MKISNPVRIGILLVLFSLLLQSCAMPGATPEATVTVAPSETFTPAPTATITPTPTLTPKPTATQTSTPVPNMTATQMYEDFSGTLKELYDAKYINTTDGKYLHLPDFKKDFAKINYFQWYETAQSPSNFVLRSDIAWDSASAAADNSGCGFVFHLEDNDNLYIFYVSLKGIVRLNGLNGGKFTRFGGSSYGSAQQKGQLNLTLIVQDEVFKVLVNDKLVKTYQGFAAKLLHGELAYTVLSGTNKSFGTRCNFTNTVLWTLP